MPSLRTDAVVLHIFNYLETSRILRVATRDAGVQSVLARGARRPKSRYGTALDLFASGTAEIYIKPGRELHTLAAFDVTRSRGQLAEDLDRFTAASAIAELAIRFATGESHSELYDVLIGAFDDIGAQRGPASVDAALGGAWHLVGEMGFAPTLDVCASCHAIVADDAVASFSHPSGGVVCRRCASLAGNARQLPPDARASLRAWLHGASASLADDLSRRAHQRLLREFLSQHLSDGRPLRAYEVWERSAWAAPAGAAP
ncbi:MAG TPA: DNA repair protein RecO [Gemmatimonadaceae bacterium]|nr:DNA repair protein RecO [Gemmatimonadaceae bacterium]